MRRLPLLKSALSAAATAAAFATIAGLGAPAAEASLSPLSRVPAIVNYFAPVAKWPILGNATLNDCSVAAAGDLNLAWNAELGHPQQTISTGIATSTYFSLTGGANSGLNDCSVAAAGDLNLAWNAELGHPQQTISTGIATSTYFSLTGGANSGLNDSQLLSYWQRQGVGNTQIAAYGAINSQSIQTVKQAIRLFGGLYVTVGISSTTIAEWNAHQPFSIPAGQSPTVSTAHVMTAVGYDANYVYGVSWGRLVKMTWGWWTAYAENAWAIIPEQFVTAGHGPIPSIPVAELKSWLSANSETN
jgi:hypothetical protein